MKQLHLFFLILFSGFLAAQELQQEDLQAIEGTWTGNLVYLDYSSNKEVLIPVELTIVKLKEGKYQFAYVYPEEPKANSKEKISIDIEARKIAGDPIVGIDKGNDGWVIKSVSSGKDNGKSAGFFNTYRLRNSTLTIKKEVQYEASDEVFMRNEYRLKK